MGNLKKIRDYDFVGTHRPMDPTTGRVMSKGEPYVPHKKQIQKRWHECPELRKVPRSQKIVRGLLKQYVNFRFGKFTVVGIYAKHKKGAENRGRWVVKCDCGFYELKRLKTIRNEKNVGDRCGYCWNDAAVKRRADRDLYGVDNLKDLCEY